MTRLWPVVGYVWLTVAAGFLFAVLISASRRASRVIDTALQDLRDRRSVQRHERARAAGIPTETRRAS